MSGQRPAIGVLGPIVRGALAQQEGVGQLLAVDVFTKCSNVKNIHVSRKKRAVSTVSIGLNGGRAKR